MCNANGIARQRVMLALFLLSVVAVGMSLVLRADADEPVSLRAEAPVASIAPGDGFRIDVVVDSPERVSGVQANVVFDPSKVQLTSIELGPNFSPSGTLLVGVRPQSSAEAIAVANTTGALRNAAAVMPVGTSLPPGAHVAYRLQFTSSPTASPPIVISLQAAEAISDSGQILGVETHPAGVSVGVSITNTPTFTPTPDPRTPTRTPTPTPFFPPPPTRTPTITPPAGQLRMSPQIPVVAPGRDVLVDVIATAPVLLAGVQTDVRFDSAKLELRSVAVGLDWAGSQLLLTAGMTLQQAIASANTSGNLRDIALFRSPGTLSVNAANGMTALTLTFRARGDANGPIQVTPVDAEMIDGIGTPLGVSEVAGIFSIAGPPVEGRPTATATPNVPPTPVAAGLGVFSDDEPAIFVLRPDRLHTPCDGETPLNLRIRVLNRIGFPVADGTDVHVGSISGFVSPGFHQTANGEVTAHVRLTGDGPEINLLAWSGRLQAGIHIACSSGDTLPPEPGEPNGVLLAPSYWQVPCDGATLSGLGTLITDVDGNPVPGGLPVTFSVPNGVISDANSQIAIGGTAGATTIFRPAFVLEPNFFIRSGNLVAAVRTPCTPDTQGCSAISPPCALTPENYRLFVEPATLNVSSGEQFQIRIMQDTPSGAGAVQTDLRFNPELLLIEEVLAGSAYGPAWVFAGVAPQSLAEAIAEANETGSLRNIGLILLPPDGITPAGVEEAVVVRMRAKSGVSGGTLAELPNAIILANNYEEVIPHVVGGTIIVGGGGLTPFPTATSTSTPTATPTVVTGFAAFSFDPPAETANSRVKVRLCARLDTTLFATGIATSVMFDPAKLRLDDVTKGPSPFQFASLVFARGSKTLAISEANVTGELRGISMELPSPLGFLPQQTEPFCLTFTTRADVAGISSVEFLDARVLGPTESPGQMEPANVTIIDAEGQLLVAPTALAVVAGATLRVDVVQRADVETRSVMTNVQFDRTKLELVSVQPGTVYTHAFDYFTDGVRSLDAVIAEANSRGALASVGYELDARSRIAAGEHVAFTLEFRARTGSAGTTQLLLTQVEEGSFFESYSVPVLLDSALRPLYVAMNGNSVTIEASAPLTPSTTPAVTETASPSATTSPTATATGSPTGTATGSPTATTTAATPSVTPTPGTVTPTGTATAAGSATAVATAANTVAAAAASPAPISTVLGQSLSPGGTGSIGSPDAGDGAATQSAGNGPYAIIGLIALAGLVLAGVGGAYRMLLEERARWR